MNRDGTIFRASSAAGEHFHPLGCGFNVPDPSSAEANVDPRCENLCNLLAKRLVDRDFKGAHSLLAPWYRSTISPDEIEGMVDAANEGLAHPPHGWTVGEGLAELEELRQPAPYGPPSQNISKEITSSNTFQIGYLEAAEAT